MRRTIILAVVAALLGGGVLINQLSSTRTRMEPLQEMARMRPTRAFAPRVSIPTAYHPCTALPSSPADTLATMPTETCGGSDARPLDLGGLAQLGESVIDPDSLHASGLAAIIWQNKTNPSALDDAIRRLQKAARLSANRVPLLVDLSAAYLVRAPAGVNPRDLMEALQAAQEALSLERGNPAALFNAALAQQLLGLEDQASQTWDEYLAVDSTSGWAHEARARKEHLLTRVSEIPYPAPGASRAQVVEFAMRFPQEAREYGWHQVLGDWGGATVGDEEPGCAAELLRLAEQLGGALERQEGGDASLADAVRAIRRAQSSRDVTLVLARAHRDYAAGQAAYTVDRDFALAAFERVIASNAPSPVLLQWARTFGAGALYIVSGGRIDRAMPEISSLLAEVDSLHHPALAARARWMLGTMLLRGKNVNREAGARYLSAASLFRRAGETQYMGAMLGMAAEATYELGDTLAAYRLTHRAQMALRPYRNSVWLHTQLHGVARYVVLDEMPRAALALMDEDVRVTRRLGVSLDRIDALHVRSRIRSITGDPAGAARDVDSVYALVPALPKGETQRRWASAVVQISRPGNISTAQMDAAVASFSQNVLWLVPALIRRADVQLRENNPQGALRDLELVTAGIRGLSRTPDNAALRGAVLEQARSRFDGMVMLNLRMGRPADALAALESGRLSFTASQDTSARTGVRRLSAPPGHVALEYALIGNTLLTWTIQGDTLHVLGQPVDRDSLLLTVEQVAAMLESPGRADEADPGLRRLYDLLIRPVRGYLGAPGTRLVIIADGEVAGVPFAALLDERDARLIERHPLRYAPTLADAARPAPRRARTGRALLVADPEFGRGLYPALGRLDGAGDEVGLLQGLYGDQNPVLLSGPAATRAAFVKDLQAASVVHYAGHAVFDDTRPERSFLVLAGADRLTVEDVTAMRLRGVRLVVLSACRTLRSREGRSGGFAGFSGALLAAGAGGVVGSLWQVDDRLTPALMQVFHEEFRNSDDPAVALREAQLKMLRSSNAELRSPATWAGFRYTGAERP